VTTTFRRSDRQQTSRYNKRSVDKTSNENPEQTTNKSTKRRRTHDDNVVVKNSTAHEVVKSQQKTSTLRNVDTRANGEEVVVVEEEVEVENSRISTGLYSLRCLRVLGGALDGVFHYISIRGGA